MGKYAVQIFETTIYEYHVEADSESSAADVGREMYENNSDHVRLWSEPDDSYPYVVKILEGLG